MSSHISEERIALLAGGDLDAGEAEGLDAHLSRCPSCAERLEGYREGCAALGALREEDSSTAEYQALRATVLERLENKSARPLWLWSAVQWTASAAGIFLALGLGLWWMRGTQPLPVAEVVAPLKIPVVGPIEISPEAPKLSPGNLVHRPGASMPSRRRTIPAGKPASGETLQAAGTERTLPPQSDQVPLLDDIVIKMETGDPNVIIIWLASPRGEER